MTNRTIVALDAMGGDNAPKEMIKGSCAGTVSKNRCRAGTPGR